MKRPTRARLARHGLLALSMIAGSLAGGAVPADAGAAVPEAGATVANAKTDNYKAIWNADPSVVDRRTWLQMTAVSAGGVTYTLQSADCTSTFLDSLVLHGDNGSLARLTVTANEAGLGLLRIRCQNDQGAPFRFGPFAQFATVAARNNLPNDPVTATVHLAPAAGGADLATATAEYRSDPILANQPQPVEWPNGACTGQCLEYNGPNGRWHVNGQSTPFDWGDYVTADTPPTVQTVFVESGSASRRVRLAVVANDDHGVTDARYANEDGVFSSWRPLAAGTPSVNSWLLSSSAAAVKAVTVQVRDTAGQVSANYSTGGFRLTPSHDLARGSSWYNDLLVRRTSDGAMILYQGTSTGGLSGSPSSSVVAGGWSIYDRIVVGRDLDGDGRHEVLARVKSGQTGAGQLRRFQYDEATGRLTQVGIVPLSGGWGSFPRILAPGDLDSDGRSDLLVVKSNGTLWLVTGNGAGGVTSMRQLGTSTTYGSDTIITPGDFTGDGKPDLIMRDASGVLRVLRGNGTGGFSGSSTFGSGWSSLTIVGTGDMNLDGNPDITARKSNGTLWVYKGNGTGTTSGSYQIGTSTSWSGYDRLA